MSRRWLAPELIQTSAMDCGPAALKCLLEGFGIDASVGRLREACQTDVDGTSIDTLEEVAVQLGLDAEQTMMPPDHLLRDAAGALPALIVTRRPDGLTHFVVLWRRHGGLVQAMDPASGRRWLSARRLREELYIHELAVSAAAWREHAGSAEFLLPLTQRISALGIARAARDRLLDAARADATWRSLAMLDGAARLAAEIVAARAIARGAPALRLVESLLATPEAIPATYFHARAAPAVDGQEEQVVLRGAVLVRVRGRRAAADGAPAPLPRELAAALREPRAHPLVDLFRLLRAEGALAPSILLGAILLSAALATADGVAWQAMLRLVTDLGPGTTRLAALAALVAFMVVALLVELGVLAGAKWMGRHLEMRVRRLFLAKIPRLGDRYFQSRLLSDMAERSHTTHVAGRAPQELVLLVRSAVQMLFVAAALVWLDPGGALAVVVVAAASMLAPALAIPRITELDARTRVHGSAVCRYYLDAMLGLVPLRAHRGERALRERQEELLVEWADATNATMGTRAAQEATQILIGYAGAAWIVLAHVGRAGIDGSVLLLAFWALQLPLLGSQLVQRSTRLVVIRTAAARLLEPLGAPSEDPGTVAASRGAGGAVALRFEGVRVVAAGHTILHDIDLDVAAGSHVAIVGASGAGKSSLVGLLLGWHRPAAGRVLVDGEPLEGGDPLARLRARTVWLDPAVQLWNRSVIDNIRFGTETAADERVAAVIDGADLRRVLGRLPEGLQTHLGDGGALISGGEGQRVRLARGLFRPAVELAVLDEPFRGLDRERRQEHLARARAEWRAATLLCITHDIRDSQGFDRVIVVHDGRIVEDGPPAELATRAGSRYAALLASEDAVLASRWAQGGWRRLRVVDGVLVEDPR